MPASRLGWARLGAVVALAVTTLGVGLGQAGRLTYHEAFVAQAAREMLAGGSGPLVPTIGGRPWLEKPPLAIWLVALTGRVLGGVSETAARLPSAAAGVLLAVAVAMLAARRFGPNVGLLAGAVQATTVWTVVRGRLAEADILLACLVTGTILAFDHLRGGEPRAAEHDEGDPAGDSPAGSAGRAGWASFVSGPAPQTLWLWAFYVGLGLTSLAKGVGFGAVLVLASIELVTAWDHDRAAWRRLQFAPGWIATGVLSLWWPALVVARHPSALGLWTLHVTDRLASQPEHFAGQTSGVFLLGLVEALLPWMPLALLGAWRSLPQALAGRGRLGGDRLLWAWTIGPLLLLALATVRNDYYAIHALPPCSVWAALALVQVGRRLRGKWGWSAPRVRLAAQAGFVGLGVAYAVGFLWVAPRLDRRGVEWAFYESAARRLQPGEPVNLLYHVPDWDRQPYQTPFGPFPHDWAVRLYYLGHPAPCLFGVDELRPATARAASVAVIGRQTDHDALARLGRVETLARGPETRSDRAYVLYRLTPTGPIAADPNSPRATRTR